MSRRDTYHQAVVNGLVRDGWIVTDDPLVLEFANRLIGIDLAAEKLVAAEREGQRIAVEIKSFQGSSDVSEFHTAVGQFLNYRFALEQFHPKHELYLAVPQETFSSFFQETDIQEVVKSLRIRLLVYDAEYEEITQWKA